ncbi:MAG TPA: hypothetical protein V6D08_19750 [Candidatus Obscuribacterales bacterium]
MAQKHGPVILNKTLLLIGMLGLVLWAGIIVVHAGGGAFISFWHALLFLTALTIAGSATRTIGWPALTLMFCWGAFSGSLALLVLQLIDVIGMGFNSPLRVPAVALIDEAFMLAPLIWLLWRSRAWWGLLGVTDVLLMAAACGTGFGFVEHAFVIHRVPSVSWLWWMPLSGIATTPRDAVWLINSHGVLAALAGATIGAGLLLRHKGKPAWILAASGAAYGLVDRLILGNLGHDAGSPFGQGLAFMLGWGWLTLWLFFAGVALAVLVDAYIIYLRMPARVKPLGNQDSPFSGQWWSTQLEMRALAFAGFRYSHASAAGRSVLAGRALAVLSSLVKRYKKLHPELKPDAAASAAPGAAQPASASDIQGNIADVR